MKSDEDDMYSLNVYKNASTTSHDMREDEGRNRRALLDTKPLCDVKAGPRGTETSSRRVRYVHTVRIGLGGFLCTKHIVKLKLISHSVGDRVTGKYVF